MSNRKAKPTKTMQINFLRDKLDEFATAMKYLMEYMDTYGITPHYQKWVEGMATDKDLPNKLVVSELKKEKPEGTTIIKTE